MFETVPDSVYRHEGLFDGSRLTVTYALEQAEHETRTRAGRRGIHDEFLLAALLSVPEDTLAKVSPRFDRVLRDAVGLGVAALVDDPDGSLWAQRRAMPAVAVQHIDITSDSWKCGREIAHRWAGYGPRVVHVPAADPFDLIEASHYGVGVSSDGDLLVPPAPFTPQRWTSARWRFAELVYDRHCSLAE